MCRLSYGICRCTTSYTTQVVQVRLLLRVAQCTCTACPIDIIPSILWPGRGKCNIVGTIIIRHPVLIKEGCRELWKVLDTKKTTYRLMNLEFFYDTYCTSVTRSECHYILLKIQWNSLKIDKVWFQNTITLQIISLCTVWTDL